MNSTRFVTPLLNAFISLHMLACSATFGQTDSVWIGGTGNWNDPANWNPMGVPNGNFNVLIDDGNTTDSSVSVNGSFLVDSLDVEAGDLLRILNRWNLTIAFDPARPASGTINNAGTIQLEDSGNNADFRVEDQATLAGGGTLRLGFGFRAALTGTPNKPIGVLTNVDNIIEGRGTIGAVGGKSLRRLQLINELDGIVLANNGDLNITPSDGIAMVNRGVYRADGGTLVLQAGDYNNAMGLIVAENGSTVELGNTSGSPSISGGTLRTNGTGSFSGSAELIDTTVEGLFTVFNQEEIVARGTLNNTGEIELVDSGQGAEIRVPDSVSLTGGGTIDLRTAPRSRITGIPNGPMGILTNVDNVIEGRGSIGNVGSTTPQRLQFINESAGVVLANDGTRLLLQPPTEAPMINRGVFRADGGILLLSVGEYENTDGLIVAEDGAAVEFGLFSTDRPTVVGGTLQTVGTGILVGEAVLAGVTLDGELEVENGDETTIQQSLTNLGTVKVFGASSGDGGDLEFDGEVQLTGGGMIVLNPGQVDANLTGVADGMVAVLTNFDNEIMGSGRIGTSIEPATPPQTKLLQLINESEGTVTANGPRNLQIQPPNDAPMINRGIFRAAEGGNLHLLDSHSSGFELDNSGGSIVAESGGLVEVGQIGVTEAIEILGGNFRADEGGVFEFNDAALTDVTFQGNHQLTQDDLIELFGVIGNEGVIEILSSSKLGNINANGPVQISGPGTIRLGASNQTRSWITGTGMLELIGGRLEGEGLTELPVEFDGASIAPGNSIGELVFESDIAIDGNTTLDFEFGSTGGMPGVDWDHLDVTAAAIELGTFTVKLTTLGENGHPGPLADFDPDAEYQFVIARAAEISGFNPGLVTVDTSEFVNPFDGKFSVTVGPDVDGNEILFVKYGEFALGDVNGDGDINLQDIPVFVAILTSGESQQAADLNCDGVVNTADISLFVALLVAS